MKQEPKLFDAQCAGRKSGLHEVYLRKTPHFEPGVQCRACGALELGEYDFIEAVVACAKSLVAGKKDPKTAHTQIDALELALLGAVEALQHFRDISPKLGVLIVRRGSPIGGGPKDR